LKVSARSEKAGALWMLPPTATPKTGVGAAIGEAAIAKALATSKRTVVKSAKTPAVEAAETAAVETAKAAVEAPEPTVKATEAAAERDGAVGPDHDAQGDRRCYFAAVIVANGIFSTPAGNSGVNTGSAMRGAKSQSLKTAENCGWDGCVL
jgi:hypothetical protein